MYNYITSSAAVSYPNISDPSLPQAAPYEEQPQRSATNSTVTFYRSQQGAQNHGAANPIVNNTVLPTFESIDDTLEKYKRAAAGGIFALIGASIAISIAAMYCIFAGFTFINGLQAVYDAESKKSNLTLLFGTVGTMVGLYETDSMSKIMNATVAKMEGLWNWDNMSNTTHEFLTFNVAFTLSVFAGLVAQGLVSGALAAADQHSQKKLKMQ